MAVTTEPMITYVRRFRGKILDTDPMLNTLNDSKLEFTDDQIAGWIEEAWYYINESAPPTRYSLEQFPRTALLLDGAMMMMMEARGLLHLRNQISYSDAGFSVNMDDKAGTYAQWMSNKASLFLSELKAFKRSRPPGFIGVASPLSWWRV